MCSKIIEWLHTIDASQHKYSIWKNDCSLVVSKQPAVKTGESLPSQVPVMHFVGKTNQTLTEKWKSPAANAEQYENIVSTSAMSALKLKKTIE